MERESGKKPQHEPLCDGARKRQKATTRATVCEWAHKDLNLELPGYEPGALTIELWARGRQQPDSV